MRHLLTDRVRAVEPSPIRSMFDLAEAAAAEGRDLVRLEVGEPDFDTPEHVVEAAHEAARSGRTHYTPNAGIRPLREAVSEATARESGTEVPPEGVVVTNGAMEATYLVALATVGTDEEYLLPTPTYTNYFQQTDLVAGRAVEVPMPASTGFELDADRVVEAMGPDTAAVMLCSPSNPTGRVHDPDAVRAVVEAAADHDAVVVADEVYGGLVYDREFVGTAALTDHPEHVVTVGSCSKTYAMTGWRVGWLAGPRWLADAVTKVREAVTSCTATPSQYAALAALTGPQEPVREMRDRFEERRDYVVERAAGVDGVRCPRPDGAFYAFLELDLPGDDVAVAERLLREHGVVLAPGSAFGEAGAGWHRLSFANGLDRLEVGFDRLERALSAF
ncbi:pyridoxal phosphate-dependent aminotransferase [Halobium salinum]|uniref:Aminotransferase n=1 Tax=Halobium salinum TaxID=1364940 RepID=A0ABD5P7N4_9EURY|nr:pyridoxal phosphate-dependent aminotransferase [Halobium salinum]